MKKFKYLLFIPAVAALVAGVQSCKLDTAGVKDNITSAQDFSTAETEFAGAFDVADDINQSDGKIKKGASTILPSGAVLDFVDSTFTDGDGIEYTLDFGPVGGSFPYGILCGDGKYRAGKLRISVSKPYAQIGTSVTLTASESSNGEFYYSGDGTNMFRIEGVISYTRTADQELTIAITDGKVYKELDKTAGSTHAAFRGNKVIKRTKGSGTPGMLGDEYEVTGSGSGTNIDGEDYTWSIDVPLLKKIELGCAKTFVVGVLTIQNLSASSSLKVDFDPYKNGACDKVAKAIIGSREIIFTVK
ncbi:MAG: hypothetical protein ACK5DE_05910 [Bacteroidota bacterium]|jgi:hypothetical protein